MKRASTSSRKVRTGDRKSFARPSTQVRRRAAEFKLESLEERTLLSATKMIYPQPSLPAGLGVVYTAMSQQAHGVGLNTQSPTQFDAGSGTAVTMADLNAYLKTLTSTYQQMGKFGSGDSNEESGTDTNAPGPPLSQPDLVN